MTALKYYDYTWRAFPWPFSIFKQRCHLTGESFAAECKRDAETLAKVSEAEHSIRTAFKAQAYSGSNSV
jgi:hypothetical protein